MQVVNFLKANALYMIWFILYFCIAWFVAWIIVGIVIHSFIIVALIYMTSIILALSPIGEGLLRLMENCRPPATNEERNYLMPIFEEVYDSAKEIHPKLSNEIQLYIMDAMYVNAFAIGRKTIAVTRGAMKTFSADELKGILAHEFGHMAHGHTKALLLSVIGNLFFSAIVWVFKLLLSLIQFLTNVVTVFNILAIFLSITAFFVRVYVNVLIFIFETLGQIILALNSRSNETGADTFAFEAGYGRELISGLYTIQKISINTGVGILERAKASHPHIAYRIGYLEDLENAPIEE